MAITLRRSRVGLFWKRVCGFGSPSSVGGIKLGRRLCSRVGDGRCGLSCVRNEQITSVYCDDASCGYDCGYDASHVHYASGDCDVYDDLDAFHAY